MEYCREFNQDAGELKATENIALFDMDGSLANYEKAILKSLELLRSPNEPVLMEENLWDEEKKPYISARMKVIKSTPGWWYELEPIASGMEIMDICRRIGFDIHILTKGPKKHSNAWAEKVEWCKKHIGEGVDIHITSDKGLVYGKLLYDDYPEYMLRWLKHRPRGLGIMPVTEANKNFKHPNVIMYRGIEDMECVIKAVQAVNRRKKGEPLVIS